MTNHRMNASRPKELHHTTKVRTVEGVFFTSAVYFTFTPAGGLALPSHVKVDYVLLTTNCLGFRV